MSIEDVQVRFPEPLAEALFKFFQLGLGEIDGPLKARHFILDADLLDPPSCHHNFAAVEEVRPADHDARRCNNTPVHFFMHYLCPVPCFSLTVYCLFLFLLSELIFKKPLEPCNRLLFISTMHLKHNTAPLSSIKHHDSHNALPVHCKSVLNQHYLERVCTRGFHNLRCGSCMQAEFVFD